MNVLTVTKPRTVVLSIEVVIEVFEETAVEDLTDAAMAAAFESRYSLFGVTVLREYGGVVRDETVPAGVYIAQLHRD